jgi:caa(3)-type oxidase subunit IV
MSDNHDHGFSVFRVFITLLILTALEVAWGAFIPYSMKALLWGGLLTFAVWKGTLIFMYFMHMKFEGWICKVLVAPTIPLVAIIVFTIMPDVSFNSRNNYEVGQQWDPQLGEVKSIGEGSRNIVNKEYQDEYPDYHETHPKEQEH